MLRTINAFINDESGAVTVDWVVLTAALVGLGLAVMSVVSGGIQNLSGDVGQTLANQDPVASPFPSSATFTANSSTYTEGTAATGVNR
ncbi:Flp family type IVb pilin [Jannaschia marina]|uniref:Flp family type IVb pilin n=1 Tax=Jannaschia marina TaxID=2741674 RepID=UPI0015C91ACC|nr:hypothetical protein [Jannaschia marina]